MRLDRWHIRAAIAICAMYWDCRECALEYAAVALMIHVVIIEGIDGLWWRQGTVEDSLASKVAL